MSGLDERRYQVFVSSTFEDLKDEREKVLQAVLEMKAFPAVDLKMKLSVGGSSSGLSGSFEPDFGGRTGTNYLSAYSRMQKQK